MVVDVLYIETFVRTGIFFLATCLVYLFFSVRLAVFLNTLHK